MYDSSNASRKAVRYVIELYPRIFIPRRTEVNVSNNPVDRKFTKKSKPVECGYMGAAAMHTQV